MVGVELPYRKCSEDLGDQMGDRRRQMEGFDEMKSRKSQHCHQDSLRMEMERRAT
jgi:hypothetical protein